MQWAGHLLTVVLSDTPRKAHFWGSVDNLNVKEQIWQTLFAFEAEPFTLQESRTKSDKKIISALNCKN